MSQKVHSFHFHRKIFFWITLIFLLLSAGGCQFWQKSQAPTPGGQQIPLDSSSTDNGGGTTMQGEPTNIPVQLSEGQSQPQTVEPLPQATGVPLSDEEINQVLVRLPELTAEPGDQSEFQLANQPIPPPKPGVTISESFPPKQPAVQPAQSEAGPLEVLRYAPEGEIPIAPFVDITFNQPMVPLGTLADLAKEDVPVKLEPDLPGTWRWLGTQTLTFTYDSQLIDRLPKATSYRVTIPAGIKSALGGTLAETLTWTFSTPAPKVVTTYPNNIPQPVDPLFFISFDQRITPAAVLETVQVNAGGQRLSLKLASDDEVQANPQVKNLAKYAQDGRWLAFKAAQDLPLDTSISVTIGPGTPSAEGPLTTVEAQSYSFYTYAPLRVVDSGCAWSDTACRPLTPFFIRFNNPLDVSAYDPSLLTIQPEIPGVSVNFYGDTINIQGATQGSTTYTVIVKGDLQDVFGQKLGKDARLTFKVGQAEPMLSGPQQVLVTLDPTSNKPTFSVYAINYPKLDLQVYAVQPSDWLAFKNYLRQYQNTDQPPKLPGRLVRDETLRVEAPADALTEVKIDLSQDMDGKYAQFIVVVAPPKTLLSKNYPYWQVVHAWVQVTQIGLDAFYDHSQMVAWASALQDGKPLPDVSIETDNGAVKASTGADGLAKFDIPNGASYLVAKLGADTAMLPNSAWYYDDSTWNTRPVYDELRWYVFDDRQMYRPGESVHLKGWLRRVGGKQDGDVGLVGSSVSSVTYQAIDPQGNDLGGSQVEVNALGGFDFSFTLPDKVNLGYAQLYLNAQGSLDNLSSSQYSHTFQIQEFRRPEFEVTARNETTGPYFAGGSATLAVEAKYYAGGPLPGADVTWLVTTSPSTYSPPNWPDFTFGTWTPWWYYGSFEGPAYFGPPGGTGQSETFTGQTDSTGTHYLNLDFDQNTGPKPLSVVAEATVMDLNRQAWSDTTTLLVHPADLYVGLRSQRYFVDLGTPLEIDFIVTDLDGNPVSDRPVEVTASRLEWKYTGNGWSQESVDTQTCKLGSKAEPVTCTFQTPVGGTYQISATVTDELGRQNQSQFERWVSGGKQPPARQVEQEQVTLIPDKETYQPGDTAQILVQSPFSPAEGLLTLSRSGILYTQRFEVVDGTATLSVPIEEKYIPNLNLQVDLVGSAPRIDDQGKQLPGVAPRPAFATGQLDLKIPPLRRTLALQVKPDRTELEPGGETTLNLTLKDASGQPVSGAELAVVVVDEAILALSNYQLTDPLSVFYTDRPAGLTSLYSRSSIILANPQDLQQQASRQAADMVVQEQLMEAPAMAAMPTMTASAGMKAANEGAASAPIAVRSDFNPLALFAPTVRTSTDGTASVPVKLPDNLTRYRVMVVAVDGSGRQFGTGEANLVARLPLMVRPSAPRFLNFGDAFELPVLLQNQTADPLQVDVVVQGSNIHLVDLNSTDGAFVGQVGLRITVPARDRVEVRFPATTDKAGTALFQVAAVSGTYADAVTLELPVYTPATTEAFATYGVIDNGAISQPVLAPSDVFPQYGGLEITTSSTALQALTDAFLYLVSYPFECTEQIASRVLAIASLRDVLTAFNADGLPSPATMQASVQSDIERLASLQNDDGGFPYWRHGQESIPFNTIHVAHALQRAKMKDFDVPTDMQQRVLAYLQNIESYYPSWYGKHTRWTLSSYALYVRDLMGDSDPDKALKLYNEAGLENLSLDAIGWLWQVLSDVPSASTQVDEIRRYVNNHAVETAGAANFTTSYDDQNYLLLGSDRRTDAILLDAMINDTPESDLIPKLVNGLLAHSKNGRWSSTQENVFVLVALDRYFNTFEAQAPDFVARIWLGEAYAGEHAFSGYTTDSRETLVPMAYLVDPSQGGGGTQDLILSKDGTGRLYYRLGMQYAPTDLQLAPLDMGFVVMRTYTAVDDPADVSKDENGVWHIKAGARVQVRLTMVARDRRYHVALSDPLPAGLEIVNPALEVSGSTPQDPGSPGYKYGWWWWGTWYEHQNLRDERAEAFTSLLWDGVYEYDYYARATTPGTFVVPPAKAEEMYSPEVFGRSASDVVIVK